VKDYLCFKVFAFAFSLLVLSVPTLSESRPNILLIVADDMGYSDVGAFGGEIATPAIDQLAAEGMRLSNFHVLPTCSPTRSVLFSGVDNHLAGLGTMGELRTPAMEGNAGYAGYLNFDVVALPELLSEAGYQTYIAGKWHLGLDKTTDPFARGFQQSFALLPAGGSHWNDKKPLSPPLTMIYTRNGEVVDALPEDFYSSRYFTDVMLGSLRSKQADSPFFAYLSFTAPHNPLHAPRTYIEKYRGTYDQGWDKLRSRRLHGLQRLGLVKEGVEAYPRLPFVPSWDSLPENEKKLYARDMEVYAAMIDYMDEQIARVIDYLKETGQYQNTLIIFMSDNGANGSPHNVYPLATAEFLNSFDNSLKNRGLKNSYIDMGAGWAQASMVPSRLFKGVTAEGGVLSPLVIKLPNTMSLAGAISSEFVAVRDIMPTVLDVAEVEHTGNYAGRAVLPMQGQSLLPLLSGQSKQAYAGAGNLGLEFFGSQAYIAWPWKILKLPPRFDQVEWMLFNLQDDPGETRDLSAEYPQKLSKLKGLWKEYKNNNNVIDVFQGVSQAK